ncbi:serine carboxypeptidase II-2-like isoform X2 [Papaver somniferum]|uniref:serine carboxypeptidase II-2-like isoform X2 n=1 Tax=Papaver somniferum TaxID=3469 RepID=UPI000E6FD9F8|nr:serine carboxypeptidase II-2-like isoform X2 [Papaver somniferum]
MEKQRWVLFLHLLFLIVNLESCFSTTNGSSRLNPIDQQELDRVNHLPGQDFNVDFQHYSGYVTVNEDAGRNLFYWFIEATKDPSSKPLILWINGGPGCSSIGYGEAMEIGPFHVEEDAKTLYLNPHSWNQMANLLFIDTPVGTGYSYSKDSEDVINNGDARTANDNLVFLQKWLERFPQFKGSDFYIIGESYAGHYVPQLAKAIAKFHKSTGERSINLKGIMVGNGLTDDHDNRLGSFQFLWTNGLISDETYNLVNNFCLFESYQNISSHCRFIFDLVSKELGDIDPYSIFTSSCTGTTSQSSKLLNRLIYGGICEEFDPCIEDHTSVYFNLPEVRRALHADPVAMTSPWEACNGDTDSVTPVTSTRYSINSLKLPTVTPFHAWYDNGQVGGWTQEYKGLTFVSVRGAGHDIPMYKPSLAYPVIKAYLSGISMPTQSSQLADS